jgi:DNA polymerase III subunit delta
LTPDEALRHIEQETTGSLYFLYGEEKFFHTEIIQSLLNKLITPENREFNLETFDARGGSVHDWLQAIKTLSFLGGTKVVVVKNLHEIALSPKESELLLAYTEAPLAGTCLILTADKADRKKKIFKSLTKIQGAISCQAPNEFALVAWIKKRAQSSGYTLSPDAARQMVERTGPKPGILASELEKVMTYVGKTRSISDRDILAMVGDIKLKNPFALTEALKDKNAEKAFLLLHNQLEHGEDPLKILGTVVWQFRVIWEVKSYRAQKLPPAKIAQEMGAKPFLVEKALKHTQSFSRQELTRNFKNLTQADRELKTSGQSPQGILEALILKLCSGID